MRPLVFAISILCVAAPRARAQERVDLRLELPVEALHCLHQGSLADGIDARVREEGLPAGAVVEVSGEPVRPESWRLRVAIAVAGEPIGEREIVVEETECETAVDAIALVVVLALRGSRGETQPDAEATGFARAEPPPFPVQPSPPPAPVSTDPVPPPEEPSIVVRLHGDGGVAFDGEGVLAGVAGFGLELALAERWSIGALAIGRFPSTIEVVGGELLLTALGARVYGCVALIDSRPVELGPCAALAVGMQRTAARGFDRWNGTSSDVVASAGVGVRFRMRLPRPVYLQVDLLAEVPLVRPALTVKNESDAEVALYRTPILTVTPTLGLGVELD